ncbi:MAG: thiamine phosphate synthase [Acidimicrobiia bacterium]|nr:thiamine phosphate synthase [Acidimicrobiia bacterium]MBV9042333.1 thiamine phosphate synthase [Acidimicrobiia bacterium]
MADLANRCLYLCTPDRPDLEQFVDACIAGGVDIVQLRDKNLEARAILERARLVQKVCRAHGVPFILNDRPDLALEVEADGVHVGQDDAPPSLARRLLGPDAIVGLSTHAPNDLDGALEEPVDYLSAGPVSQTPTKPGRAGTGLRYLTYVVERAKTPWFVTGGVTPDSVKLMAAAGARRFVVVRYLTEAEDPKANAATLRDAIDKAIKHA